MELTLSAGFAYDDSRAIQKNPDLLPQTPLWNLAYDDFWGTPLTHSGSHKSYRPLCVLTFRLNYWLGELDPWGYHLGNVICHAVTTAVFTMLVQALFVGGSWNPGTPKSAEPRDKQGSNGSESDQSLSKSNPSPLLGLLNPSKIGPATAGLLFAAHPIHTEAVAGVVGRADVLACLFFLLTLLSYMHYVSARHSPRPDWRVLPALLTVLLSGAAMITKEPAIMVLAVCAVYDILVVHRATPRDVFTLAVFTQARFRRALEGVALLAVCFCSLLGFRIYFMGNKPPEFAPSDNPASDSDSLLTRTLTYNFLPAANFWMVLCPRVLSFDWSMEAVPLVESLSDPRNIATIGFYVSLLFLVFKVINTLGNCEDYAGNGYVADNLNGYMNGVSSAKNHQQQSQINSNGKNGVYSNNTSNNNNHTSSFQKTYSNGYHNGNGVHNGKADSGSNNGHTRTFESTPSYYIHSSCRPVDIIMLSTAIVVFPFIPASNMFFYVGFVLAERVLYIPSMGVCLLVGLGVHALYNKCYKSNFSYRMLILTSLAFLIAAFSAKTVIRNRDWQTEEKLYKAGVAVNPAKAWGNLANIFNDQQAFGEAEEAYRNALKYRPNMADVHYNLGILLQNQKRYQESIESYKKAIHFRPKLSVAHLNLGILTAQFGDTEQAKKIYSHCADLDTSGLKDPRLHDGTKISCLFNYGRLLMDEGDMDASLEKFHLALKRRPDHYAPQSLYNMLGEAYFKMERLAEAEKWYLEALKVKPDHMPAHLTMSKLKLAKNQPAEAEEWLMKAKKLDPDSYTIDNHIAQLYASTNRHKEAMELFETILPHLSEDFDAVYAAAAVYREGENKEKAEELYIAATKIKPKEPAAWMNLGAMLHINGKYSEAEQAYLTALQLKPGDKVTTDNLKRLRNITKRKG
ncbi:hypothetical protein EGW08_013828 [Elysia chlorotica]|uniref:dolichyl-phosphate-mannose--protein mannosyltransferase n=1 Tax=Elysia chlorotica TaxID=188477 RepID=A0A433TAE0_ELYCH|nr:hypothetical protein EGW08_013828 [Elysia chlorotica]